MTRSAAPPRRALRCPGGRGRAGAVRSQAAARQQVRTPESDALTFGVLSWIGFYDPELQGGPACKLKPLAFAREPCCFAMRPARDIFANFDDVATFNFKADVAGRNIPDSEFFPCHSVRDVSPLSEWTRAHVSGCATPASRAHWAAEGIDIQGVTSRASISQRLRAHAHGGICVAAEAGRRCARRRRRSS